MGVAHRGMGRADSRIRMRGKLFMKKKLLSVLTAVLAVGMLTGCGSDSEETTVLKDMKVDKYVTVGEYKGLQVSVDPITVDETELNTLVDNVYFGNVTAENGGIVDRAVAVGDTVNIDYEGKKDGVAFSGGTAQGQSLIIGSGMFIDGFEDGLVGVMPGETVDLNLTFPENYGNEELNGQAVVFTVKVNFIVPQEKDDAVIAAIGIENVTNEEELRQYAYDYLYSNAEQSYNSKVQNAVMEAFMANCVFKDVPQALVEKYKQAASENIAMTAESYGMDADSFTTAIFGMDLESYLNTYCEETVKQDLAIQSVANKENLNISDEELDAMLLEQAQAYGLTTIEEYLGETSKEDYREYYLYDKILDYLVENAVVNE